MTPPLPDHALSPTRRDAGPIVVIIIAHHLPELLHRNIRRILEGNDIAVVLHRDPKAPRIAVPKDLRVIDFPNPEPISWGSISLARAVFRCLEFVAKEIPDFSWALTISGQDYLCRGILAIERELRTCEVDAYVRWYEIGAKSDDIIGWQDLARKRYLRHLRLPGSVHHIPFPRRSPFGAGAKLYVGDMWGNYNATAVAHLLDQRRRMPMIERYLTRCQIPDEALMTTFLLNGETGLNIENDRRRYMRWIPRSNHPELLLESDFEAIRAGDDFFARKFSLPASEELLDMLDESFGAAT